MSLLKNRFVVRSGAWLANHLLKWLYRTCDVVIDGACHINSATEKTILMLWHNRIVMAPEILAHITTSQRFTPLISNSRDGEIISAMVAAFNRGRVIRVPHDLRHEALRQTIRQIRETDDIVVITPDGPRGPRYTIKGGIALAAKESEAKVVPLTWSASHFWQLDTWDGLMIPKPFSRLFVTFGAPISLDDDSMTDSREKLRLILTDMTEKSNVKMIETVRPRCDSPPQ